MAKSIQEEIKQHYGVYISEAFRSQGVGRALLTELIRHSEVTGYWSIQATITRENTSSRELCKKSGFREVGIREKLGKMPNGTMWC